MNKPISIGSLATLVLVALTACNLPPAAPQTTLTATGFFTATPTSPVPTQTSQADACPITTPVWVKPPEDAAVKNPPEYGYYFVNQDRSIWMSAWWTGEEEHFLTAIEQLHLP